jgi:hypothetical protein
LRILFGKFVLTGSVGGAGAQRVRRLDQPHVVGLDAHGAILLRQK